MKISKYTFFFDIENTDFYAYNTLSNALIEICLLYTSPSPRDTR